MTAEKAAALAEEKIKQEEEMREQRKNDSKEIAGETIRRELAEREYECGRNLSIIMAPIPLRNQHAGYPGQHTRTSAGLAMAIRC